MQVLNLALNNPVLEGLLTGRVISTYELCSHDATRNCTILIPAILLFIPLHNIRKAL